MAKLVVLDLDRLHQAIPEMTESLVGYICEAAVFCFHHHRHRSGVECQIRNLEEILASASIVWTRQFSDRIARTYGDTDYAVEYAAECIACLTVRELTDYTVIERSQRHDGVDFWLAERDEDDAHSFQRAARMESKGITGARYPSDITYPLNKGVEQSKQSDQFRLPAYIIATEFSQPIIYMVQR